MSSYKMLVLDIDGTATNSRKQVTPETREAVIRLQQAEIPVAIASGRPSQGIAAVADTFQFQKYGGYILAFNGAKIINWKTKECVYSRTLTSSMARRLARDAREFQIGMITYEDSCLVSATPEDSYMEIESKINRLPIYVPESFDRYLEHPVPKCLFTGDPDLLEKVEPILADKYCHEAQIFRSEPFFLEATPKNIDKAYCLEKLLKILSLSREELICCGDGYNDISMIQFAGLGVAMANAQEKVKEVADYITASNDEDGVASVIRKFFPEIFSGR